MVVVEERLQVVPPAPLTDEQGVAAAREGEFDSFGEPNHTGSDRLDELEQRVAELERRVGATDDGDGEAEDGSRDEEREKPRTATEFAVRRINELVLPF